jgi:hypothetical protein
MACSDEGRAARPSTTMTSTTTSPPRRRRERHQCQASQEEAAAVVAIDPNVDPTGYGLGRHGWISASIPTTASAGRRNEIEKSIRTSYTLVPHKELARAVLEEDEQPE